MEEHLIIFAKDMDTRVDGITIRYLGMDNYNFYFSYNDDEGAKRASITRKYFEHKPHTAPIGDLLFRMEIYKENSLLLRYVGKRPAKLSDLEVQLG